VSSTYSPVEMLARITRELEHSNARARTGLDYIRGAKEPRIGTAPRDLVWERGKAQLWRYRNPEIRHHPPLLLFMGLVSRPYVFDLLPENSFVGQLVEAGFDLYLLDWGVPDEIEADNTFETYVERYLPRSMRAIRQTSETDGVTLMPYCMGAVFGLLLAATRDDVGLHALVTLAAPIDYAKQGVMTRPLRDGTITVDLMIDDTGLVPPDVLRGFQQIRKPTGDAVHYASLWQRLTDDDKLEGYLAMSQWIRDHIPMPGAAFRQMAEMFILGNGFIEGTARLGGRAVSLEDIDVPILSVLAERDDVVPIAASRALPDLVGRDLVTELVIPSGHAGLVVGRAAAEHTMPQLTEWLRSHSYATEMES
jgi:polyhydroxyalkanoate synthase